MSTAEIIAELPRLSPDELAQVQAKLRELVGPSREIAQRTRIHSPRLAHPEQSKDFVKQIVEPASCCF
ncbi:MAG TPA: hypothetical protein VFC46_18370 [Humisphaera sp.]|nr:hypothetical protein [Humisphaera sp.]